MDARVHGARVRWEAAAPDTLAYDREDGGRGSAAELRVVQRAVEAPSDQGWGSNELVRITTSTGGLLGQPGFEILYAVRVQRRWRRAEAATGERVVEGLLDRVEVLGGVLDALDHAPRVVLLLVLALDGRDARRHARRRFAALWCHRRERLRRR